MARATYIYLVHNNVTKITRRGEVVDVYPFTGSFCKVTIECNDHYRGIYTCGLADAGRWPEVGDTIEIDIVARGGKELTNNWRKV